MIFLPVPDGEIADTVTFHEGFITDHHLYKYRTFFPRPQTETVYEVLSALEESRLLPQGRSNSHYTIKQINGSWIGSGFQEFCAQISSPQQRYESVSSSYPLDTYKNESAIFIALLNTEDYLILNVDPWSDEGFRDFDIRLILDGLPLNDGRLNSFLDAAELDFGTGKPLNLNSQVLSGKAISGMSVQIREHITDDRGWVDAVVCENPLYNKKGFLSRFFPEARNIVADYKYVVGTCRPTQEKSDTATIEQIKITDYNEIGRHSVQNFFMKVSLSEKS